jgi:hypothetical protein
MLQAARPSSSGEDTCSPPELGSVAVSIVMRRGLCCSGRGMWISSTPLSKLALMHVEEPAEEAVRLVLKGAQLAGRLPSHQCHALTPWWFSGLSQI